MTLKLIAFITFHLLVHIFSPLDILKKLRGFVFVSHHTHPKFHYLAIFFIPIVAMETCSGKH